ncbi:hypothetical protein GJU39_03370 [Pedobacter petrophilus]|uniref:Uncharacterized protein n=1 Tax=Pedobacter petrophilus TaxID=1908241 RepID=A0A7K0FU62_9SPHI|nr:hypothetical protein [Pedobacter petrophilus]MRX75118.1 hypothetical protein [Pedobacter petrophilus]
MKWLSVLFFLVFVFVKLSAQQKPKPLVAKVIYNVVYNQEKGIKIYPKLTGLKNANSDLLVNTCFYLENGKELKNFYNLYCCESGKILAANQQSVSGNPYSSDQLFIFIPYAQLNLSRRKVHKVKFALNASIENQVPSSSKFYHSIINML